MAKKRKNLKKKKVNRLPVLFGSAVFLLIGSFGALHYVFAKSPEFVPPVTFVDPNFGIKNKVIEFFEANDAAEMIPIIKCESQFKHYNKDGSTLRNKAGSNAIGVAQIMSSVHPDVKIINRYNKRYDTDLTVDTFDVTTFEGNIGYALVLYQMNGVRDWECSKKFHF